jgi:hypothetical protein
MHHLIYLSRATQPFSEAALLDLLQYARHYNAQHDITGILAYGNGQFMQVLEGEQSTIAALYEHIAHDPRHDNLVRFADKTIAQRSFTDWSMAFSALSEADFSTLAGYVQPTQLSVAGASTTDDALLQMLRTFVFPTLPAAYGLISTIGKFKFRQATHIVKLLLTASAIE